MSTQISTGNCCDSFNNSTLTKTYDVYDLNGIDEDEVDDGKLLPPYRSTRHLQHMPNHILDDEAITIFREKMEEIEKTSDDNGEHTDNHNDKENEENYPTPPPPPPPSPPARDNVTDDEEDVEILGFGPKAHRYIVKILDTIERAPTLYEITQTNIIEPLKTKHYFQAFPSLANVVMSNSEYMDRIFRVFHDNSNPMHPVQALCLTSLLKAFHEALKNDKRYDLKLNTHIKDSDIVEEPGTINGLFSYIRNTTDILNWIAAHLDSYSVTEYLICMLVDFLSSEKDEEMYEWINNESFIENLLFQMGAPDAPHENIKLLILGLVVSVNKSDLTEGHAALVADIKSERMISIIVSSILVHLTLVERHGRENGIKYGLELLSNLLGLKGSKPKKEKDKIVFIHKVNNIAKNWELIKKLIEVLNEPPSLQPVQMTTGLVIPVGSIRLSIIQFLSDLVLGGDATTINILLDFPFLKSLIDLFWAYPNNSILHHKISPIIVTVLKSRVLEGFSQFLFETNFVEQAVSFFETSTSKTSSHKFHASKIMTTFNEVPSYREIDDMWHKFMSLKPNLADKWEQLLWNEIAEYNAQSKMRLGHVEKPKKTDECMVESRRPKKRRKSFSEKKTPEEPE